MIELTLFNKRYRSIADAYRENYKEIPVCEEAFRRRVNKTKETRIEKLYPEIVKNEQKTAQNVIIIVTNAEDLSLVLEKLGGDSEGNS